MRFQVVCVGEQPSAAVLSRLGTAGVQVAELSGDQVVDRLAALDPRGYVMNSFGPPDGPRVDAALLDLAPSLQLVTYMGASRELDDYLPYIDPVALRERGIAFTSTATPDYGVAEAAVGLLHALELNLVHVHVSGKAPGTRAGLYGATLGIVGMGQLGHRVAELVQPLGMRLVYHSRSRHRDVEERYGAEPLQLPELFAAAQHVTIHLPNSAPNGLIGAVALNRAEGIMMVNTSSAPALVDPEALLEALRTGRVRRVAIEGSYQPQHQDALRALGDGRVLLLPGYTSWDTHRSRMAGWDIVTDTYTAAAAGGHIPHRLA